MSYELLTNTAVRIAVGPLVDPTDGKTIEGALTVADMTVEIEHIDGTGGGAVTRIAFTPAASGSSNDMALVTSSAHAIYDLELTAANVNWLGSGKISLYDVDGFLVYWDTLHVVSANYFNNKYGSTIPKVDVETIKTQVVTCGAAVTINPSVGAATIVPTNTQFEARSLASADYTIVSDLGTVQTGDSYAIVNGDHGLVSIQDDIDGIPTTAEFEARTLLAADYTIVSDLGTVQTADNNTILANGTYGPAALKTLIDDVPTVAEFEARSLASADYTIVSDLGTVQTGDSFARIGAAGAGLTDLGSMSTAMLAEINAEILDVLNVDTFAEPGDEIPASTTTLINKISYLYKFMRNKVETTSTKVHVFNDAGDNKDHTSTISDDATTFTRGEFGAGDA